MSDMNQDFNKASGIKAPVPSGINVLSILTFIASGIIICYYTWYMLGGAKSGVTKMEELINSPKFDDMPAFVKKMNSPEMLDMARKAAENCIPISLINILGAVLCIVGAVQMRKLQKQGSYLYVVGEVMPLIASLIFIGVSALSGIGGIIGIAIVALFIILYSAQRKHLVN
jgi:hypothetical protein